MEEKFLFHIWDAGHLLSPLKTKSGKPLQVRYQGQYNTGRGPDFRNVVLELNGEVLKGDVEIHINAYDWIAHEHHEDAYYNNVILHVVLRAGQQHHTIREDGTAIEILELHSQLSEDIRKLLEAPKTIAESDNSTYCGMLSAIDNDTLESILTKFGKQRFRNKARRFNAMLLLSDFDQVFYEGMLEALGYEKNKQSMVAIAQALPLKDLSAWKEEGMTALELVSILSCSGNLLSRSRKMLPKTLDCLLRKTYEEQRFFARQIPADWQLFRIRPQSHPLFRLIAVANLLYKTLDSGLLKYFVDSVDLRADAGKAFRDFCSAFSECRLPGAEKLPQPGKALLGNIFINIFLPIAAMYYGKHGDTVSEQLYLDIFSQFPALQENHILRHMGRYLSKSHYELVNSRSIFQQGLMEIFHRHCHYHQCEECYISARN
jgi:hypothetical protein